MTLLDKAKRWQLDPCEREDQPCYAELLERKTGHYLRADDPVLLAMEEYIAASEAWYIGHEIAGSHDRYIAARAALLKLGEDKP